MANHKSAIKRIRSDKTKNLRNRYFHKTARNLIKKISFMEDKKQALKLFPKCVSIIDKLAKRNIIHKNKASRIKSKLSKSLILAKN